MSIHTEEQLNLNKIYKQLQRSMERKLEFSNEVIQHNGEKGASSEADWLGWFKKYLPKRYQIDRAFVVDSNGVFSKQIDVVIYDAQYSCLIMGNNNTKFVPAESVYCVFEVKQKLDKTNLDDAADKAESVRVLDRTSIPIKHAGGVFPAKALHNIPAGILASYPDWADPLGDTFLGNFHSLKGDRALQLGCVINGGTFFLTEDGILERRPKEIALVSFFFALLSELQKIATVPAIDYNAYSRVLLEE